MRKGRDMDGGKKTDYPTPIFDQMNDILPLSDQIKEVMFPMKLIAI